SGTAFARSRTRGRIRWRGAPRVRLRFFADGGFSDEDANYDSHAGPVVIDNLQVEGLSMETFEGESIGATASEDWEGAIVPGYGASYLWLFPGALQVQTDNCAKDLTCLWAAILGSPETYACGGYPLQAAVPKGNSQGQYIHAQAWSPLFPITGTGTVINFQFSVYRDMTLDSLVFYIWDVRAVIEGCEGPWRTRGFIYFGPQKDWLVNTFPVGDLIPAEASHMRVRLGVIDQCGVWCGVFGTGACHGHAPLLDNAKVYRVDIFGPVWSTRDIDMFQDTFPVDGTDTGIGRADVALSITASASPTILPGDSARVIVSDPITAVPVTNPSGLMTDNLGGTGNQAGTNGNRACYLYVHVLDSGVPSATKTGAILSGGPSYPFKDTVVADGKTWTRIQCWLRVNSTSTFVVDLNDALFEAGDVVEFFWGAISTGGETSYCSGSALNYVQSDLDLAAKVASEFTILPLDAPTSVLYVDGMDGRRAQAYWDTAFEQLGLLPHRFDVRGPTSSVSNRPGTRVTDVATQLNGHYRVILWDAGDITQNLGDGTGAPEKSNDYAMVNQFLAGLASPGGIYICGDDYFQGLNSATGSSAVTFKSTYLTFSYVTGNHRPSFGIAPIATGAAGGTFAGDTFVVNGNCPLINDFDVVTPTGSSVTQMTYGAPTGTNSAVVSKTTGNARVLASGFSFIYLRDDDEDGVMDRAQHLHDILAFLGETTDQPTDTAPVYTNRLEQNYPNPFNPQTTIGFSLKERGRVRIDVFNVAGEHVRTLLDETRAAGAHTDVRWDGKDGSGRSVASGVYFCRLVADRFSQTRKMVLVQ
ncbi:MAG TPA: T9SS type A sorting domain-containing protein, partial [Candidatus Krumholzibacteria bacterium]|nr:T9SS type A sorting domain-containing protein [Candidatus Krumholzibacteria bacterium]